MTATAQIGFSFVPGEVAQKICFVLLNIKLLAIGGTCTGISAFQLKQLGKVEHLVASLMEYAESSNRIRTITLLSNLTTLPMSLEVALPKEKGMSQPAGRTNETSSTRLGVYIKTDDIEARMPQRDGPSRKKKKQKKTTTTVTTTSPFVTTRLEMGSTKQYESQVPKSVGSTLPSGNVQEKAVVLASILGDSLPNQDEWTSILATVTTPLSTEVSDARLNFVPSTLGSLPHGNPEEDRDHQPTTTTAETTLPSPSQTLMDESTIAIAPMTMSLTPTRLSSTILALTSSTMVSTTSTEQKSTIHKESSKMQSSVKISYPIFVSHSTINVFSNSSTSKPTMQPTNSTTSKPTMQPAKSISLIPVKNITKDRFTPSWGESAYGDGTVNYRQKRSDEYAFISLVASVVYGSLYTSLVAGVILMFSSITGLCGGVCKVIACLKLSIVGALVIILMEVSAAGLILYAYDSIAIGHEHSILRRAFELLCHSASFCVNPTVLILMGSFFCLAVLIQLGTLTLSYRMVQNAVNPETENGNNYPALSNFPMVMPEMNRNMMFASQQRMDAMHNQMLQNQMMGNMSRMNMAYTTPMMQTAAHSMAMAQPMIPMYSLQLPPASLPTYIQPHIIQAPTNPPRTISIITV